MIIGQVPTIKTNERESTILNRVVGRSIAIACLAATALHVLALPFFFLCPGLSFKGQLNRVSASYLMFRVTCKRVGDFTKTENTIRQVASILLFRESGAAKAIIDFGFTKTIEALSQKDRDSQAASNTENSGVPEASDSGLEEDDSDDALRYSFGEESPPQGIDQYPFGPQPNSLDAGTSHRVFTDEPFPFDEV